MTSLALVPWMQFFWVVVGIVLSILVPILRAMLPKPKAGYAAAKGLARELGVVAAFSALVGVLVIAFAGEQVDQWGWRMALLAGYAWDSTLQKIATPLQAYGLAVRLER